MEVLAEHQITSETVLAGITEHDLADMHLVVGHKILLRRLIASVTKSAAEPTADLASSLPGPPLPEVSPPLQPFKLEDELAKIEAEFCESKAATPSPQTTDQVSPPQAPSSSSESTGSEGKPMLPSDLIYGPDGKQLKPLQLTFAQFMLANFKILQSIMAKNPTEASDYLRYLKFLATKGNRLQTKAILAFDQDYRATKSRDKFSWGANVDDLSAQYFDAAVALRPTPASSSSRSTDGRKPINDEFCF